MSVAARLKQTYYNVYKGENHCISKSGRFEKCLKCDFCKKVLDDGSRFLILSYFNNVNSESRENTRHESQNIHIDVCGQNWASPRWLSGKEFSWQCWRLGFDSWAGKIPWRRKWQPTPAFLPGEFQGQRSLVGSSLQVRKELNTTEVTQYSCMHNIQC